MYGYMLALFMGLFSLYYVGGSRDQFRSLVRSLFSQVQIISGKEVLTLASIFPLNNEIIDLLAGALVIFSSVVVVSCIKLSAYSFPKKRFEKNRDSIIALSSRHLGGLCDSEIQLKLYLSELRSLLCSAFDTHEISIIFFRVEKSGSSALMVQKFEVGFDGGVRFPHENPLKFGFGEGVLGHCWEQRSVVCTTKKVFLFFKNPLYKRIKDQNDRANSFFCVPVGDREREGGIVTAVSVESAKSSHFNWRAKSDKAYLDVAKEMSKTIGRYAENIYERTEVVG